MTLKEILDKINELIRVIQYASQSKDQIVQQLETLLILVGQALVQKESVAEELQRYATQLWISHIKGHVDCPHCHLEVPIEFFLGSKGLAGKPLTASTKDELIQKLEFPPITVEDLVVDPIPDCLPEF